MEDLGFTLVFCALSLLVDLLGRGQVLPPDRKRPSIVDRRVPGVVALVTLLLTYLLGMSSDNALSLPLPYTEPPNVDLARKVQGSICSFSILTTLIFDIRWRDRFDYGPDDQLMD